MITSKKYEENGRKKMFCPKCGTEITNEDQKFCHKCGAMLANPANDAHQQNVNDLKRKIKNSGFASKVNQFAGENRVVDLHLRDLVSGVFKHHTAEETEQLFICGTKTTTPAESDIVAEWPKPWLYSRVFILLLAVYFALTLMWKQMDNPYALMNIPYIGTLIGPITILVFFFEMNVPRNISFIQIIKIFLAGGVASLFLTLLLFGIAPDSDLSTISGAVVTGVVEEIGKIGICAYFISKHHGKSYLLNGILYGGAVGAGFAVFESVGYALYFGLNNGLVVAIQQQNTGNWIYYFYEAMLDVVKSRGFLSPGGHIAWAAVEGFAIILAMKGMKFTWETLVKPDFLKIVWIPIILHALWDAPLFNQSQMVHNCKMVFLVGSIWIILLIFINQGLRQISRIKEKAQEE